MIIDADGRWRDEDDDEVVRVNSAGALDEARARWQRGEKKEALHHLEYALGRDFSGLGDLKPEDLA